MSERNNPLPRTAERQWMSASDIAALFYLDPSLVTRWADAGKIEMVHVPGSRRRYDAAQVRALLDAEHALGGPMCAIKIAGWDFGPERLMTPAEVAAAFRVDVKTVARWALADKLASIRTPGGHRRFSGQQVEALLRDERAGGAR